MTHPYLNDIRLAQARMEALLHDAGIDTCSPMANWPGLAPSTWRLPDPLADNPARGGWQQHQRQRRLALAAARLRFW